MDPTKQKLTAWLILGGAGSTILAFLANLILTPAGSTAVLLSGGKDTSMLTMSLVFDSIVVLGGLVCLAGIIVGFVIRFAEKNMGRIAETDAVITSRFAMDVNGYMIFSDFDASPGAKLFVHLKTTQGEMKELRASWPVFLQCGEGMHGLALMDGEWLTAFNAHRRPSVEMANFDFGADRPPRT